MTYQNRIIRILFLALGLIVLAPHIASAQKITTTTEGLAGERDSRRRGPVLSVSHELTEGGGARLLADFNIPHPDYRHYPVRVEFYVNRRLFSSQIRSAELPGPIGIDLGPDQVTIPFNYTVIATVLHPNRSFPTVLNGAVFSNDLVGTFNCRVTFSPNSDNEATYRVNDVKSTQSGNNSFALTFLAKNSENGDQIQVAAVVSNDGTGNGSSDVRITRNDLTQTHAMSGTVASNDDSQIESFNLATSDKAIEFACN